MSTRIARLFAAAVFLGVVLAPATAVAGCSFNISPTTGYRGYNSTITGSGLESGTTYYVKFNGADQKIDTVPASGNISATFTVPNDAPSQSNWVVFADSGCQMTDARDYTVQNGPPPTTTTSSTITTTTTTLAPTTTEAPTTTLAATTTEAPTTTLATTTSLTEDTTTTTEADSGGGGGVDTIVIVLIALVVLLGLGLAFALGRRRSS